MRKSMSFFLVIILSTIVGSALSEPIAPGEYIVGIDIPAGWYSIYVGENTISPVFIGNGCNLNLAAEASLESVEAKGFTAEPGIYSVPNDLPAGRYEVTCADGFSWTSVGIWDSEGKLCMSGNLHADGEGKIGLVDISDGFRVKVEYGSARFDPSAGGITFD